MAFVKFTGKGRSSRPRIHGKTVNSLELAAKVASLSNGRRRVSEIAGILGLVPSSVHGIYTKIKRFQSPIGEKNAG